VGVAVRMEPHVLLNQEGHMHVWGHLPQVVRLVRILMLPV
jgi:hypothetical protein